ncbi:hypothetical protein ASD19_12650 [Microbacterium sp. Root53]|nr:hypothetical protein ASD19_12650 [Microbacterium sp. Root53]
MSAPATPEMPSLGDLLLDAMLQVPGQLWAAVQLNPGPWALVGAMFAGLVLLKWLAGRKRPGAPRRR